MKAARRRYQHVATLLFIAFASATIGHFLTLYTSESELNSYVVPKVYVERCSYQFNSENCGEQAKDVIFFSSDKFLGFTKNWAVGRIGDYKQYMSCFEPSDDAYTDGTHSTLTVVVAGPDLLEAHKLSKQLMIDFANELPEKKERVSHCIEK
ncbi:MAG: Unknown protein [uncultured Thiotrichaceae bacterium]|uniref:Uncharacterized protein n=1 Tax=uncultured Thiotrichaceae bacterium TaxID=298394 RepID=A0A6S6SDD0_9GAMM|nr:MAG: Unknown protein [uncultured Thiotrichaceae bacterium]